MKVTQIVLLSILATGSALAADEADTEQNVYASQLCHIVSGEKNVASADHNVAQMKSTAARSQSPSAMNQPEFDAESAREGASARLQLGDDGRGKLRVNAQQ
ncbi:MAG TPA: hypothetical protein DD679_02635, partial [Pantoea agglomerans]|nr:hypothetical protein [Pantoea agglomerans]